MKKDPALIGVAFSLLGCVVLSLVAYCMFGGWGVLALALLAGLLGAAVRSELAESDRRRDRCDEAWIRWHVQHNAPNTHRRRARQPRGGVR